MVASSCFKLITLATPVKRDHLIINNYIKNSQDDPHWPSLDHVSTPELTTVVQEMVSL